MYILNKTLSVFLQILLALYPISFSKEILWLQKVIITMTEVSTLDLLFGKSYFVKTPVFIFTDIKHNNGHTKTDIFS